MKIFSRLQNSFCSAGENFALFWNNITYQTDYNINERKDYIFVNSYKTEGVCANKIDFTIKDGKVEKLIFHAGCPGNLEGVSRLVVGMEVNEVIRKLKGISCSGKSTSCPDQLARALEDALAKNNG